MRSFGRLANQVVNRCRAKGGSRRTLDTPVAFSTTLRTSDPLLAPMTLLANGAAAVPTLPIRSVRPMTAVVARSRTLTCPVSWRIASARSISRGKSMAHSCRSGT
jgi:hypothetical protein